MAGAQSGMLTPGELVWLVSAVAKGDDAAFDRLYAATRAKLYGVVLRILRRANLADEVMQDTYLRIWRNAGAFDADRATPITWMVAIARNRALDVVRKKRETSIEEETSAMEVASDDPSPLARHEMTDELKRLLACLGDLEEVDPGEIGIHAFAQQPSIKLNPTTQSVGTGLLHRLLCAGCGSHSMRVLPHLRPGGTVAILSAPAWAPLSQRVADAGPG